MGIPRHIDIAYLYDIPAVVNLTSNIALCSFPLFQSRYDFAVYGLLASEIGSSFFPKSSKELQLMNSFGVYLAAFLMRCVPCSYRYPCAEFI